MINLPYDFLPGSGIYSLAFYGADQKLALQPTVRITINMPIARAVQFSDGTVRRTLIEHCSEGQTMRAYVMDQRAAERFGPSVTCVC